MYCLIAAWWTISSVWKQAYEDRLKETRQQKKGHNEDMGLSVITRKTRVSDHEEAAKLK